MFRTAPRPVPGVLTHLLALALAAAPPSSPQEGRPRFVWDAVRAEHLWNRAGFGATPEELERSVELGLEATVAEFMAGHGWTAGPFTTRLRGGGAPGREDLRRADRDTPEVRAAQSRMRREDGEQLHEYLAWWVDGLVEGESPLRERMTLFWHGYFTSSMEVVRNSHEMILQNQLLRRHALGSFRELVHAIARDPAMLEYLDNDANRRGSPNENFARELMELFTLGEGNYGEDDVKEAARAFTGWTDRGGRFRFLPGYHDYGVKTVLGVTGRLDGDDVIEILLEQDACPRYLARRLLTYLEGVAPESERLERYARRLRELDYEVGPLLAELFRDPDFYRDEVRGTRIAGPVDFLVGCARRLGAEPPPVLVGVGTAMLGQRLFFPPSVKGWEGGDAWITTASLMQRGNLAGVLLGQVDVDDFLTDGAWAADGLAPQMDDAYPMEEAYDLAGGLEVDDRPLRMLRKLERRDWRPRLNLTAALRRAGAQTDREAVVALTDRLLAVPLDMGARERLVDAFAREREAAGIPAGLLDAYGRASEELLRRFAHLVLSLPEAQLH